MEISKKLRQLRKEHGYSQAQVAALLTQAGHSAAQAAVSRWERGETQPDLAQFLHLCRLYQVRDVLSVFLGEPDALESLNADGRQRVREYIRLLEQDSAFAAAPETQPLRVLRTLPLYALPASAGTGQFLDSDAYELLEVDETVPLSATFAVRLSGDSMTPRFADGQIVYVQQRQTLESGATGIFLLNGSAYCKVLRRSGSAVSLVSLNPAYSPIPVTEYDELRILGKVVG